jgi:hypothetical protein
MYFVELKVFDVVSVLERSNSCQILIPEIEAFQTAKQKCSRWPEEIDVNMQRTVCILKLLF